ncbi:MAG: HAD family hydrolase [Halobacteriaceae archaeon]
MSDTDEYEAVVYDLDGTLVHLDVDWEAVERELRDLLDAADVDAPDGDTWDLLDAAESSGLRAEAEAVVGDRERDGAESSRLLPTADELPRDVPVAVCSLNCEGAVRIALGRHGLRDHVDAVVGRDSGPARKPDPAALLSALERVDAAPDRSLFVGDSASDELTAERAGVDFRYVEPPS